MGGRLIYPVLVYFKVSGDLRAQTEKMIKNPIIAITVIIQIPYLIF